MINAAKAIDAVLRFPADRQGGLGDVGAQAEPGTIEKTRFWTVKLRERHSGPDAWMKIDWKPVSYFVDEATGLVIGFAAERSTTMLR